MIAVTLPELGCDRATLSVWHMREGDFVQAGERLVEVLIPGATIDVIAPASGRLHTRLASVGNALAAGAVLGRIAEDA